MFDYEAGDLVLTTINGQRVLTSIVDVHGDIVRVVHPDGTVEVGIETVEPVTDDVMEEIFGGETEGF